MDALNSVGIPAIGRIVALFRLVGIPNPFIGQPRWYAEIIRKRDTPMGTDM